MRDPKGLSAMTKLEQSEFSILFVSEILFIVSYQGQNISTIAIERSISSLKHTVKYEE